MRRWVAVGLLFGVAGCAKLPDIPVSPGATRVNIRITLDEPVNPNYIYIVGLNPSNDDTPVTQGPIPVIAPPWGNGMMAGQATHFVRWSTDQSPRYQIYEFLDAALNNFRPTGVPLVVINPGPSDRVLQFEIDLTQIAPTAAAAADYRSLQINLFTMDRVPQGSAGTKNWDALGDGNLASEINSPITIPLRTAAIYDNARYADLEPRGDQADPTLDMVDFRIEVRPQ